jgi:hypothetical protein
MPRRCRRTRRDATARRSRADSPTASSREHRIGTADDSTTDRVLPEGHRRHVAPWLRAGTSVTPPRRTSPSSTTDATSAFDRLGERPHAYVSSGDACAGSEHPTPRSPRRVATRSPRPWYSPGDHQSHGPSPPECADRPGKALTGHDVQELPRATNRRASLSRRASRRCAAPAATSGRRPAPLLRHERLSHDPSPRPPHGRRGLPDLRLRTPARLTGRPPSRGATTARWAKPGPRPWTDRG